MRAAKANDSTAALTGCQKGTPPTVRRVIIIIGAESGNRLDPTARGEWDIEAFIWEKK